MAVASPTKSASDAETACGTPSGATAGHLASVYSELENAGIICIFKKSFYRI